MKFIGPRRKPADIRRRTSGILVLSRSHLHPSPKIETKPMSSIISNTWQRWASEFFNPYTRWPSRPLPFSPGPWQSARWNGRGLCRNGSPKVSSLKIQHFVFEAVRVKLPHERWRGYFNYHYLGKKNDCRAHEMASNRRGVAFCGRYVDVDCRFSVPAARNRPSSVVFERLVKLNVNCLRLVGIFRARHGAD